MKSLLAGLGSNVVALSIVATIFYSISAVILDRYVKGFSPLNAQIVLYVVALAFTLVIKMRTEPYVSKEEINVAWVVFAIVCSSVFFYFADLSYFTAILSEGSSPVAILAIIAMVPVVTGAFKAILDAKLPDRFLVLSVALAVGSVLVLAYRTKIGIE